MQLKVIRTVTDFKSLKEHWQSLDRRACNKNLFLSFDWLDAWVTTFSSSISTMAVVTVWEGKELVGSLPLYTKCDEPAGVFWFLGSGEPELSEVCSEGLDVLLLSPLGAKFGQFLTEAFIQIGLKKLIVSNSFEDSFLARQLQDSGFFKTKEFIGNRYFIRAKEESTKLEKRTARYSRAAEKLGVSFHVLNTVEELDSYFDELKSLHNLRWRKSQPITIFDNDKFCSFHLKLAEALIKKNSLSLVLLKKENKSIAINYSLVSGNDLVFYQSGVDTSFKPNLSPGMLLHRYQLELARELKLDRYDFLLSMPPSYKESITECAKPVFCFTYYECFSAFLLGRVSKYVSLLKNRLFCKNKEVSFAG